MTSQAHCNWWAFYGTHQLQCRLQQVGGTVRTGGNTFYLLNDHLTSTAITTNSSGVRQTDLRYFAYGGTRYDAGSQMTIYRYTGQQIETGTGLYDYGARWDDPHLNRWIQPETIVPEPGDPQSHPRIGHEWARLYSCIRALFVDVSPDILVPEPGNWYAWRLPSQVRRR